MRKQLARLIRPASRWLAIARRAPAGDVPYELNHVGKNRPQGVSIEYSSPDDTRIEVFWKDFTRASGKAVDSRLLDGVGPVLSFIVCGHEVMRFDCLGESGHFHVALMRPRSDIEIRLWVREQTALEQVERAIFELRRNLDYYLPRNPLQIVRETRLPAAEHDRCCDEARAAALTLWERNAACRDG